MVNVQCKICNSEFAKDSSLHKHLKTHSFDIERYYSEFYPRYDLFSREKIKFHDKEQYFSDDFVSPENMRRWLRVQPNKIRQRYMRQLLITRKEKKSLEYCPSQVELRSLNLPSIIYYNEVFGDYYSLCKELGFKVKNRNPYFGPSDNFDLEIHSHIDNPIFHDYKKNEEEALKDKVIFVDTREQKPLDFRFPIEVRKLDFGDYAFGVEESEPEPVFIERKSPTDFIGTLSGGFERFENEIDRATFKGVRLFVVVESLLSIMRDFDKHHILPPSSRVRPEYIFHRVRALCQKYENLQFVFVKDRDAAQRVIKRIFFNKLLWKEFDIQYVYDKMRI